MTKNVSLPIFLTVIIPVYNEHEVLRNFHSRLVAVLASIHKPIEILYVDDGSQDTSGEIIKQLKTNDPRISYERDKESTQCEVEEPAKGVR